VENERVAKLEAAMESLKEAVAKLHSKFDQLFERIEQRYLPRSEFEHELIQIKERFKQQEAEIRELRSIAKQVPSWAVSLMTAMITVIGALVVALFTK
jgi:chromosome segregation ATPase